MLATQKSLHARPQGESWVHIDISGQTLGRVASEIAFILLGKHRTDYTPGVLTGDRVVVTGASKLRVTGAKLVNKIYYHHSRYPGGLKAIQLKKALAESPERTIEWAVSRMLPKNKLHKRLMTRLKVYAGAEHPHTAQKPVTIVGVRGKVSS
jgi:large subunit ribosomal protein L13